MCIKSANNGINFLLLCTLYCVHVPMSTMNINLNSFTYLLITSDRMVEQTWAHNTLKHKAHIYSTACLCVRLHCHHWLKFKYAFWRISTNMLMHNSCTKAFFVSQFFISLLKRRICLNRKWQSRVSRNFSVFFFISIIKLNDAMKNDFNANVFLLLSFIWNRPLPLPSLCLPKIVVRQVCKNIQWFFWKQTKKE